MEVEGRWSFYSVFLSSKDEVFTMTGACLVLSAGEHLVGQLFCCCFNAPSGIRTSPENWSLYPLCGSLKRKCITLKGFFCVLGSWPGRDVGVWSFGLAGEVWSLRLAVPGSGVMTRECLESAKIVSQGVLLHSSLPEGVR